MKNATTKQTNRRCHAGHQWATNRNYTTLRILLVVLLCGCLSEGSTAWGQTRSATTSTSRSASRAEKAADARSEKKAADARTAKKAAETRSSETKRSTVKKETERREETNRGGRSTDARVAPSTRLSSGYRLVPGNRNPERNKIQLPDIRFRHDHERCVFCFGVGFVYSHDRLNRLRCSHCNGRGFDVAFVTRLDDVCPICYSAVSSYGSIHRRSLQNTATYVTDRLDHLLDLSRSQERRIKRIVLEYLRDSRYESWFNPIVIRDREIMRELSNRQRDIYMDFMNNLDNRDLCDRCFDYF